MIADQRQEGISRENLIGMIENAHSPLLLVDRKRVVIAAGVIPGIRDAAPIVAGRARSS